MPMQREERIMQAPIPANYKAGLNIGGFSLDVRRLAEGIGLGLLLFWLGWEFGYWTLVIDSHSTLAKIGGVCGATGLALGVRGVNGGPLSTYIFNTIKSLMHRRRMRYNPRVKYEDEVAKLIENEAKAAARENNENGQSDEYVSVASRLIGKIRGQNTSSNKDKDIKKSADDLPEIFADDVGITSDTDEH